MPSMDHEILADLFKNRPSLAPEILTEALGATLPPYTEARLASVDLTEVQPAEYRADVVVLLLDGSVLVRVIIVEDQLATDGGRAGSDDRRRVAAGDRASRRRPCQVVLRCHVQFVE